jgi:hypothetical protein
MFELLMKEKEGKDTAASSVIGAERMNQDFRDNQE